MFEGWDDYYLLVGSAAAALIGLLFVVVTLTTHLSRSTAEKGTRIYMSPLVFHLAVIVLLSGMAMAPHLQPRQFGTVAAVAAITGLVWTVRIIIGIRRAEAGEPPHWSDVWCYGAAPGAVYVLLAAYAAAILSTRFASAEPSAVISLLLLLITIRNAWDLVTWLAPRASDSNGQTGSTAEPS